jgi:hypothetical protein
MRKLKYLLMFILSMALFNSCLDDTTDLDQNSEGPNIAGFEKSSQLLAAIADGVEYPFEISMKVMGPTYRDISGDITITVAANAEASTAIEGTHFRLDASSIIVSPGNNLLGLFTVTMLTEGIVTPLDKSPVLVLNVTAASGDPNVINSGKPISLTLNYACPSFLEETYDVTTEYTAYDGTISILNWTETMTETGIGTYRTERVGHWTPAQLGGTPGFTFTDVCGVLSIAGQNLVDLYSNWVEGTGAGSVDPVTADLYMEYSICTDTGCRYYKSTYVKQ